MTDKDTRPADQDEETGAADDTEGHSLLVGELGRAIDRDRARGTEQATREARMREQPPGKGRRSLFKR
jgi:hypothetical protein